MYFHVFFFHFLLLLLVLFFHLLTFHYALQLLMSFHENADECMTIDFLREVPVGSEL